MTAPALLSMLTDYGIALAAVSGAIALAPLRQLSVRCWAWGLVAIAMAAAGGGTVHGMGDRLPAELALLLWKATLQSLGVASTLFLVGIAVSLPRPLRFPLLAIAAVKATLYAAIVTGHNSFLSVAIDHLVTLMIVLLVVWQQIPHQGVEMSYWMGSAGAIAVLATGLLSLGASVVGVWADTLYHLAHLGTLYCLYRSARLLKDG